MNNRNQANPYDLKYIEEQIEAIKTKQNRKVDSDLEQDETRNLTEIMDEQLSTLKQIQQSLQRIENNSMKKGWKRLL